MAAVWLCGCVAVEGLLGLHRVSVKPYMALLCGVTANILLLSAPPFYC